MKNGASSNTASLVWIEAGVQKEQLIPREGITIGRSSENSLVIDDLAASRFHCKVLPEAGVYQVVDLESRNGTYLNGARLTGPATLKDGDRIKIGQLEFRTAIIEVEAAGSATLVEASLEAVADSASRGEASLGAVAESATNGELPLNHTMVFKSEQDLPWLMISSGPGKGATFSLSKPRMQVGRASKDRKWDIDLIDKSVSRPHAEFVKEKDGWLLKDMGSANGTLVNGKRIKEPYLLKNGDALTIGDTVLIYRFKGGG